MMFVWEASKLLNQQMKSSARMAGLLHWVLSLKNDLSKGKLLVAHYNIANPQHYVTRMCLHTLTGNIGIVVREWITRHDDVYQT